MSVIEDITSPLEQKLKEDKELLAKEKKPEELIVLIWGDVTSVTAQRTPSSITIDNGIIGPGGYSYTTRTGDTNRLEIWLSESARPVEKIIFHGDSPVRVGDCIQAYVVKGEYKILHFPKTPNGPAGEWNERDVKKQVLVEGELKPEMSALYIEIRRDDGRVIRTDYGVHYDPETKKVVG